MGGGFEFRLEGISSCVVIRDKKASAVDDKFSELTGYSRNEIEGMSIGGVLRLLRSNGPEDASFDMPFESRYIFTKELEPRRVRITRYELSDNSGQAYSFEEVPKSRLEDMFVYYYQLHKDNIFGMAIYSVPDLTLLKANDKYLDYLEAPHNKLESCIGYKISEIFEDWDIRKGKYYLQSSIKSGESYTGDEFEVYKKDRGLTYWQYVITPVAIDGSVEFIIIQVSDVTERVKSKRLVEQQARELREQKEKLDAIIESISDALLIIDSLDVLICRLSYPDYKVIQFNKKAMEDFCKYFENPEDRIKEVLERDRELIEQMERTKSTVKGSDAIAIIEGQEKYIYSLYQPILNSKGDIAEVIKIGIDVTNKVKEKNELEKVLKMQEDFFSFIAHEFRTPLTVMNSIIQLINHIYKDMIPDKVNGYIGRLRQSTLQQLRLVNNLLDITRADSGYLKINQKNYDIVEVSRAITESVSEFAQRKGISLKFSPLVKEKKIAVDEEKYERILLNLLSNAIKFTPKDKKVTVEVSSENNCACIRVKDEGVGIPKDKQELIFERFGQVSSSLTRKSEGTGIGLCLSKLLVSAMGGRIEVDSEVGEGSVFTIYLPDNSVREDENRADSNLLDNRMVQSMDIEFSNIYI